MKNLILSLLCFFYLGQVLSQSPVNLYYKYLDCYKNKNYQDALNGFFELKNKLGGTNKKLQPLIVDCLLNLERYDELETEMIELEIMFPNANSEIKQAIVNFKQKQQNAFSEEEKKYNRFKELSNINDGEQYLKSYPNGRFLKETNYKLDSLYTKIEIDKILSQNKKEQVRLFREYHPKITFPFYINYVAKKEIELEKYFYDNANKKNIEEEYDFFLSTYPKSKFFNEVLENLETLLYKAALEGEEKDYRHYFKRFPKGKHIEDVKTKLEEYIYGLILEKKSISSCDYYKKLFPNGKFISQSDSLREEYHFRDISYSIKTDAYSSYGIPSSLLSFMHSYLKLYPVGKYREKVIEQLHIRYQGEILYRLETGSALSSIELYEYYQKKMRNIDNKFNRNLKSEFKKYIKNNFKCDDSKEEKINNIYTKLFRNDKKLYATKRICKDSKASNYYFLGSSFSNSNMLGFQFGKLNNTQRLGTTWYSRFSYRLILIDDGSPEMKDENINYAYFWLVNNSMYNEYYGENDAYNLWKLSFGLSTRIMSPVWLKYGIGAGYYGYYNEIKRENIFSGSSHSVWRKNKDKSTLISNAEVSLLINLGRVINLEIGSNYYSFGKLDFFAGITFNIVEW